MAKSASTLQWLAFYLLTLAYAWKKATYRFHPPGTGDNRSSLNCLPLVHY